MCRIQQIFNKEHKMVNSEQLKTLSKQIPAAVLRKVAEMDEFNQEAFISEFKKKSKSPNVACIFFLLGFHYAYMGKWLICILFWATMGGFAVWWFIDLFRLNAMVRDHNKTVAIEVLRDIQILA